MAPSVLLIGAGGNVGTFLVPEFLRQRSKFNRIAILADETRVEKFAQAKKDGIEIVVGWFLDVEVYRGFDVVLSLVGNPLIRLQPAIAELAIKAGVRHFYPSEFGAAIYYEPNSRSRYLRDKVVTRNHLALKARDMPGFHATYIVTGSFTEWAVSPFLGFDLEKKVVRAYTKPDTEICVTSTRDIARYIVDSILLPVPSNQGERELRVIGSRLTFQHLIDTLGAAQNARYEAVYLPVEEALANQEEARQRGDEETEILWSGKTLASGNVFVPEPWDNDKFGFKPETVEETVRRVFGGK